MNSREILARNLKRIMDARKLSQHRIGASQTNIRRILGSKGCTLKTLDDIAAGAGRCAGNLDRSGSGNAAHGEAYEAAASRDLPEYGPHRLEQSRSSPREQAEQEGQEKIEAEREPDARQGRAGTLTFARAVAAEREPLTRQT